MIKDENVVQDSEKIETLQSDTFTSSNPEGLAKTFFLVYAISAVGTAARFISRMFIELYAVIIRIKKAIPMRYVVESPKAIKPTTPIFSANPIIKAAAIDP